MTAVATHYLMHIDSPRFPEAPALARAARVIAWVLVLAGASVALAWAGRTGPSRVIHAALVMLNVVPRPTTVSPVNNSPAGVRVSLRTWHAYLARALTVRMTREQIRDCNREQLRLPSGRDRAASVAAMSPAEYRAAR